MLELALAATMMFPVALPPARFDHAAPHMIVRHFPSFAEVDRKCRGANMRAPPGRIVGCAPQGRTRDGKRVCLVFLPHPWLVSRSTYRRLFRHERGHCNGWPADHPR